MEYRTYTGERFDVRQVWTDGVKCRACFRVIRVREQAGFLKSLAAPMSGEQPLSDWQCRECLNDEPLTEHNKWRKDHAEHSKRDGNPE